jgi:hypothetical protein
MCRSCDARDEVDGCHSMTFNRFRWCLALLFLLYRVARFRPSYLICSCSQRILACYLLTCFPKLLPGPCLFVYDDGKGGACDRR